MTYTLRFEKILNFCRPGHVLYDLCCDHGLMGLHALSKNISAEVHFVDQSENALQSIRNELKTLTHELASRAFVHCIPAEKLMALEEASDFIIAGVGIETCMTIISSLFPKGLGRHRLIIAPQQKSQKLRQFLINRDFRLFDEAVTVERKRFREIIVVEAEGDPIDFYGHLFRSRSDADSKAFVQHLEDYYALIKQKMSKL